MEYALFSSKEKHTDKRYRSAERIKVNILSNVSYLIYLNSGGKTPQRHHDLLEKKEHGLVLMRQQSLHLKFILIEDFSSQTAEGCSCCIAN